MNRITIKEASQILDIPIQAVRAGIKQGKIPGIAIKRNRWTYYLYREQIEALKGGSYESKST